MGKPETRTIHGHPRVRRFLWDAAEFAMVVAMGLAFAVWHQDRFSAVEFVAGYALWSVIRNRREG